MKELDKFGKIFVQGTRDTMLEELERLFARQAKAPALQDLQESLQSFSDAERNVIRELVDELAITSMHAFLFSLQESSDLDEGIELRVDGQEIAKISDGLHGEIFTDEGWIKRFSRYVYDEKK